MRSSKLISPQARGHHGRGGAALWAVRWLLLLLLAFDQISLPLHAHRHDGLGGFLGGQHEFAAAHDTVAADQTHAHEEPHPQLSHAVMALKAEPRRWAQPAAQPDTYAVLLPALEALAAFEPLPRARWRRDHARLDIHAHRSLPPAGRAPPLHA